MNFVMRIGNKVCKFISLYRSPNSSLEDFKTFLDSFKLSLGRIDKSNSFLIVLLGEINSKIGNSYKSDSTSYEAKIDGMTTIWNTPAD